MTMTAFRVGDGEKISRWGGRIRKKNDVQGDRETETRVLYTSSWEPPLERTWKAAVGLWFSKCGPDSISITWKFVRHENSQAQPKYTRSTLGVGPPSDSDTQLNLKTPGVMGGKKAPVPTPFSQLRHVPALVGSTSTGWSMPQTHFLRPKRKMPKDKQWKWRACPLHLRRLSNIPSQHLPWHLGGS